MPFEQNTKNEISITRWLLYLLGLCFACTFFLFLLKSKANPIYYIDTFVIEAQPVGNDSWHPMIEALDYLKQHPGQSVYEELFFKKGTKFQYPLSSLLVFDIPQKLTGASYADITQVLNLISFIAVILIALVSAKILLVVLEKNNFDALKPSGKNETLAVYLLVLLLTLVFYPIIRSYVLGQIQTILTLMAALAILCWQLDKKKTVGVLIGIICLIKPQLGLLFVWAIIRKQWGMVISGSVVIGFFLLISFYFYGFNNSVQYLQVLSFLSHHGEAYYANQSINGLMNRLTFNGENLTWDNKFPPYSPVVYAVTLVFSLVFMLIGLLWKFKKKNPDIIDFSIIIVCTTLASPISWEHHYAILFPILLAIFPFVLYGFKNQRVALLFLFLAFILISQYLGFFKYFALIPVLNIMQSYLFFGVCILLFFLLSISKKQHTLTGGN